MADLYGNTTDLETIVELIKNLPTPENLDAELSSQDNLILQLAIALEGKTGGVDTSSATISSTTQLLNGIKAFGKDGVLYTGTLVPQTCYVSTSNPSASSGAVGDIWLVKG